MSAIFYKNRVFFFILFSLLFLLLPLTGLFFVQNKLISNTNSYTAAALPLPTITTKPFNNKINGWVKTSGTDLYDQSGNKIIIKGISYDELQPVGFVYNPPELSQLPDYCKYYVAPPVGLNMKQINQWGVNTLRVSLYWDKLEPVAPKQLPDGTWQHSWNDNYLQSLDRLIQDAGQNHIAVILDMHQYLWSSAFKYIQSEDGFGCAGGGFPAWLYPNTTNYTFQQARCDFLAGRGIFSGRIDPREGFTHVWRMLAGRYKDNSTVIGFDLLNEPWAANKVCAPEDISLHNFFNQIGTEIHTINPKALLIFEDSLDSKGEVFALQQPPALENSLYSIHLYRGDWSQFGKPVIEKSLARAKQWNVPFIVSEFEALGGQNNAPSFPPHPQWQDEFDTMLAFYSENNINWIFWAYSGMHSLLDPQTGEGKQKILQIMQKFL